MLPVNVLLALASSAASEPVCVQRTGRRSDQLLINLINATAVPRADEELILDEIPTVEPLVLKIELPRRPRRVHLMPGGETISWRWAKGRLVVEVPRLHIHGAVVIIPSRDGLKQSR